MITASSEDLDTATIASLLFTMQKKITDPLTCPVKAVTHRIHHLRLHKTSKSTPLTSYFHNVKHAAIKAKDINEAPRLGTITTSHQTGLYPSDISNRSLRAGGTMALLCGHINHNTIQMLGRWHRDAIMMYLHLQANPPHASVLPCHVQQHNIFLPPIRNGSQWRLFTPFNAPTHIHTHSDLHHSTTPFSQNNNISFLNATHNP
jgi:hypothetical protein